MTLRSKVRTVTLPALPIVLEDERVVDALVAKATKGAKFRKLGKAPRTPPTSVLAATRPRGKSSRPPYRPGPKNLYLILVESGPKYKIWGYETNLKNALASGRNAKRYNTYHIVVVVRYKESTDFPPRSSWLIKK